MPVIFDELVGEVREPRQEMPREEPAPRKQRRPESERLRHELRRLERRRARLMAD